MEENTSEITKPLPPQVMEIGLLYILILGSHDDALNVGLELTNAEYRFKLSGAQEIANAVLDYLAEVSEPPGIDQIESLLDIGRNASTLVADRLRDIRQQMQMGFRPEYVLSKLPAYLRLRELEMKGQDLLNAVDECDLTRADTILNELQRGTASRIEPLDHNDPAVLFNFLQEDEPSERFHQPIQVLEEMHIHPKRGKVLSIAAPAHAGKSTFMTETVRLNLPYRKIVHISLEPGDEPEVKLMMNMFSLTKRDREMVSIPHLAKATDDAIEITFTEREFDSVKNQRCHLLEQVRERWQNLKMYKIPPGTLTFEKVKQMLIQLKHRGFETDMVVIDYVDKMKVSRNADHYRLEVMRLQREFSALCSEFNVAGVTGSQLNKEGVKKRWATMYDQDETIGKAAMGDMILIYNRDPDDDKRVARVSTDKGRGEESGMKCLIVQRYRIAQFCLDSVLIGSNTDILIQGNEQTKQRQILTLLNERRLSIDSIAAAVGSPRALRAGDLQKILFCGAAQREHGPERPGWHGAMRRKS